MEQQQCIIGIDLGTTNSCVAIFNQELQVQVISNGNGNDTTPSVISFTDDCVHVGEYALEKSITNPTNTFYDIKRMIGLPYNVVAQRLAKCQLPFNIQNDGNKPLLVVTRNGVTVKMLPEELSARVLKSMKDSASTTLNVNVTKAVVTVPAYFTNSQRKATESAAKIAGLEILRIINEPTAAALYYAHMNKSINENQKKNVMVFDFGGGTFDVSIIEIKSKHYTVKSTSGDPYLGGRDIDQILVNYFVEECKTKYFFNPTTDPSKMERLREGCEKLKKSLSQKQCRSAPIILPCFVDSTNFESNMTIENFNILTKHLFDRMEGPIESALKCWIEQAGPDSNYDRTSLDDVYMVGGSSRIPRVQQFLVEILTFQKPSYKGDDAPTNGSIPTRKLNFSGNADKIVACGASLQGSIINGHLQNITFSDVTPMSLGIKIKDGLMSTLIKANTTIPFTTSRIYSPSRDHQKTVQICVYEGEEEMADDNVLLDNFTLSGYRVDRVSRVKFDITFDINKNGILTVSAKEIITPWAMKEQQTGTSTMTLNPVSHSIQIKENNSLDKMTIREKQISLYMDLEEQEEDKNKIKQILQYIHEFEDLVDGVNSKLVGKIFEEHQLDFQNEVTTFYNWIYSSIDYPDISLIREKIEATKIKFQTLVGMISFIPNSGITHNDQSENEDGDDDKVTEEEIWDLTNDNTDDEDIQDKDDDPSSTPPNY